MDVFHLVPGGFFFFLAETGKKRGRSEHTRQLPLKNDFGEVCLFFFTPFPITRFPHISPSASRQIALIPLLKLLKAEQRTKSGQK